MAFELDIATQQLYLVSSDATINATTDLALFASRPRRPRPSGDRPRVQDGKLVAAPGTGTAFPINITAGYVAVFGRLPSNTDDEGALLRVQCFDELSMWPGLDLTLQLTFV